MWRILGAICALSALLLASRPAFAFPWMIREGYTTCNTCHADPSGAGILTQYGRGMEEVLIRMPYKKDQDPGKTGNFLFGAVTLPDQLLLQTDLRNLVLGVFPPGGTAQGYDYIMQLDQSAQLKVGRFRVNGSIGYLPPSNGYSYTTTDPKTGMPSTNNIPIYGGALSASLTDQPASWGSIVARQYWLGVDIGKDEEFLLRIGRMNVPYGIRTIEHPFLVRSVTRTDINASQEHGISLAYTGEKVRGEVMAILGDYAIHGSPSSGPMTFADWDAPHERGAAGYLEWFPTTKIALGISGLGTYAALARTDLDPSLQPTEIGRYAFGIHGRISPVKALVFLAEVDGLINSQPFVNGVENNHFGIVSLLQADLQVYQGVHILAAGEAYNGHIHESGPECPGGCGNDDTTTATAWIGAWWFLAPHLDARVDLAYVSGNAPGATVTRPGTSLTLQFHGYL